MIWSDIEGWFGEEDAAFVSKICSGINNGLVVELGLFAGRSTAVILPICQNNNTDYIGVDNFKGSSDPTAEATIQQRSRDMYRVFMENMKKLGIRKDLHIQIMDTISAAKCAENESVDFCFIDADHDPIAVQKDIDAWWPKIKKNGILGGHDYQSPLRSVVDKFAKENDLQLVVQGRCWAVRKKV